MTLTKDDDTPLERAYVRHEARKRAARALLLPEYQLTPIMTEKEYKDQDKCFVTPEQARHEIEPNVVYKDGKQIKFLLLPKAISAAAWLTAHVAAMASKPKKGSRRAPNAQVHGRKLTLGWIDLGLPNYNNMRTAPTLEYPELVAALWPLLHDMDTLMDQNIPLYHDYAWQCAMNAIRPEDERDDLSRVIDSAKYRQYLEYVAQHPEEDEGIEYPLNYIPPLDPDPDRVRVINPLAIVENLDAWGRTYTLRGTPFSTIEFNRNIVFQSHEDGNNVEGTCVCITTLGFYAGGRLVFPRYGYSAELEPRDLLICDNNHEQHGNLGPIVGDRYSVVAFLHNSVMGRADEDILNVKTGT